MRRRSSAGSSGFLAYELGDVLERLPATPPDDQGLPLLRLALHDWTIAWDRRTGARLAGRPGARRRRRPPGSARSRPSASGSDRAARPVPLGGRSSDDRPPTGSRSRRRSTGPPTKPASRRSATGSPAATIYQANLTRRLATPFDGDPWPLYRRLRTGDPSLFSAYLDLGGGAPGTAPCSERPGRARGRSSRRRRSRSSRSTPRGRVSTDPIKGTRPRGRTREEDRALARELLDSPRTGPRT